ncbi:MAG: MBL fold metallo-hydrolase [Chthoniobacterales bacterium]
MNSATEIHQLGSGLFIWHAYEPSVKAELFSTGLFTASGVYLIDPIALEPSRLDLVLEKRNVAGVVVTNANHARAAASFSDRFQVPICAHRDARAALGESRVSEVLEGDRISAELTVVEIEGAAPGEIALHGGREGGTLVVGDAFINMSSYGFTFLPTKYCVNAKRMRRSLGKLLDFQFERLFFAHGTPLLSDARSRLAELLARSG